MSSQRTIGRYELQAELGRGAMGVVYRAHDPLLSRTVAIKTINMDLEKDGMEEYEARFYQEAKAAGGLNHPSIVIVYDIGKAGNMAYMAMEYIEGAELRTMLQGQPLAVDKAVDFAAQVAEGLAYAHEHHVVHRDIKPANILITPQGRAKIADFGIARMRSAETQTQTGVILGSPKYLSPEQVVGKRADHRSDVFSLGVILYQCLTGNTPFNGEGVSALMYQITNHNPAPPSSLNGAVPVMLDYILAKALAKSVDERYQAAADFAADLRECAKTLEPADSTPPKLTATGPNPALAGSQATTVPTTPYERSMPIVKDLPAEGTATTEPAPTRGLSRAFDSTEATQRLLVQTVDGPEAEQAQLDPDGTVPVLPSPPRRRMYAGSGHLWGPRENKILAATVAAALLVAAWIIAT